MKLGTLAACGVLPRLEVRFAAAGVKSGRLPACLRRLLSRLKLLMRRMPGCAK